jgi:hypothetical protein
MADNFTLQVVGGKSWDAFDDNIDVEVILQNGKRYGATLFTLANIARLFEKNRATGECAGGLYLWASGMVILSDLSTSTMTTTVKDLLETGEFERAFTLLE